MNESVKEAFDNHIFIKYQNQQKLLFSLERLWMKQKKITESEDDFILDLA